VPPLHCAQRGRVNHDASPAGPRPQRAASTNFGLIQGKLGFVTSQGNALPSREAIIFAHMRNERPLEAVSEVAES